jgi:hypothetical protein
MQTSGNQPDHLISDYHNILHQSLRRAATGITPIFVNNWRPKWESVGTGFVVTYQRSVYLVTAKHVLDCAFKNKQVIVNLFGKGVFLSGLYFADSKDFDLAVTLLPFKWLESYGITEIYAPQLEPLPSIYQTTGRYELVGFPATKNKFDLLWMPDVPTMAISISAELDERELSASKIEGSLNFIMTTRNTGLPLPRFTG